MKIGIYFPGGEDDQSPHDQDELIFIFGTGFIVKGSDRIGFKAGSLFFVEAKLDHRFVDFSHDLRTWVIFWEPPGDEK